MKELIAGVAFLMNLLISAGAWWALVVRGLGEWHHVVGTTFWFAANLLTAIAALLVRDEDE